MIARSDRRLLALTSKGLGTPGPIDVQLPSDAHDQSDVYVSSYPPGFPDFSRRIDFGVVALT